MMTTIDDPGQVLDPAVAVGEARARRAPGEAKGDPERDRGGASPRLWIVSASSATLPERSHDGKLEHGGDARITNDHLIAQMPRAVVAIEGRSHRGYGHGHDVVLILTQVMGVIRVRGEAEPVIARRKHGGGSGALHAVIALNSSMVVRCSRPTWPTAASRQ